MTLTNLQISRAAIGNRIGHLEKNSVIRITQKPLEPDLKLKIQLLAEFCHPSCDMNFADFREKCESLCIISTTQRNLKHPAPSVRALDTFWLNLPQGVEILCGNVQWADLKLILPKQKSYSKSSRGSVDF